MVVPLLWPTLLTEPGFLHLLPAIPSENLLLTTLVQSGRLGLLVFRCLGWVAWLVMFEGLVVVLLMFVGGTGSCCTALSGTRIPLLPYLSGTPLDKKIFRSVCSSVRAHFLGLRDLSSSSISWILFPKNNSLSFLS